MPCMTRLFYDHIEGAGDLCGADLIGYIPSEDVGPERALRVKPSRGDGGNPCDNVILCYRDFAKKVVTHGKKALETNRKQEGEY